VNRLAELIQQGPAGRHMYRERARQRRHQPEKEKTARVYLLPGGCQMAEKRDIQRVDQRKHRGAGCPGDEKGWP
jgi:hypothetical protein